MLLLYHCLLLYCCFITVYHCFTGAVLLLYCREHDPAAAAAAAAAVGYEAERLRGMIEVIAAVKQQ